jgi:hypothetical protein
MRNNVSEPLDRACAGRVLPERIKRLTIHNLGGGKRVRVDTNALGRVLTIETIKTQLDAAETAAAADQSITRSISLESGARRPPEIPGARLHSPTPAFHYMPVKLSIEGSARPARWP